MRTFRYFLLAAALLILAVHYPGRSAPISGQFKDFTLTLATPKARYLELQPIPIVITLKNETEAPLVGHKALEFGSGYIQLYVTRDGVSQKIEDLSVVKRAVLAHPREFKPGEELKATERLNLKLNEIFPTPGKYQLLARLLSSNGQESVSSQPVEVEIVEPLGLDAQALQFIRANDEPAYFFTGARLIEKPAKLAVLENFVAIFGQSEYADEASLLLGRVQFTKGEYHKARALFEKLSKKSDFAFAGQASDYLKRIEREEKKKERP